MKKQLPIYVTIIVDMMGCMDLEPEDEIEIHKEYYSKLLKRRTLNFKRAYCVLDTMDADLVIFDYGGMMPGSDLLGSNSRSLIRWLQDHPSSLAIIASSFTYQHGLKPELQDLQLDSLANLIEEHKSDPEFENRVKQWFK